MPHTTLLRLRTVLFTTIVTTALLFLPSQASAQPDLQIENFSVFSTLVESQGFRRVSISFTVVNQGFAAAEPSTTLVLVDNSAVNFATPQLASKAKAYISRGLRTSASELTISVVLDALNNLSSEDKTNNVRKHSAKLKSEAGRWISIGPSKIVDVRNTFGPNFGVGRITTIAVDPRSPLTMYVGARGSGLWKRVGAMWLPMGDALPTLQIDAIGIYPRTPDRVVVATPEGVFESTDAGNVWTQLTSDDLQAVGSGGGAFLIENAERPVLYLSTKVGLMVSRDGGRNWTTVLPLNSQIISLQFSTTDPTHLLASTANPPRVFEGKDRGLRRDSWKLLVGCVAPLPAPFPLDSEVWITESQGRRWVSIRDKESDKLELWRSTNRVCPMNGFTEHAWEKVSLSGKCANARNQFSYLFAHPTNPSLVFKGGVDLCRSDRAGDALTPVSAIHVDHHAIAVSPSSPEIMFFGHDGGIHMSADGGKTMQFLGEGLNNTEFLKIDTDGRGPDFVVGASHDQFTATWNNVSPVWNLLSAGDIGLSDSSLVAFDRADMTGVYEIAQSTRQVRLLRPGGGQTRLGDSSLPDCVTYAEVPAGVLRSMVSTGESNRRLLITCEGIWSGPPWRQIQPIPSDSQADFIRLKLHTSGIIVAVTDTGQVFHGLLNQPPPSLRQVFQTPFQGRPSAISFDGPGRFYVSSTNQIGQGRIDRFDFFLHGNQEKAWLTQLGEITAMTVDPLAPDTVIAAIRDRGVFRGTRTSPDNWTWTDYNNGLPFAVTVTDLQARTNGSIVAATFGRGAFQLFSRIQASPQRPKARGRVISYEAERLHPGRPPGQGNPVMEIIELDSMPGFVFTASGSSARFRLIATRSLQTGRIVAIEYQPTGPQTGTIISIR